MIRLVSLGSGSSGNAFLIETDDGVVLIDAGFSAKEIARRAEAAGIGLDRLRLIVLTHEHGDHSSGARRLASLHRVPIAATEGTLRALALDDEMPRVMLRGASVAEVGPFCLESCRTLHDAAEPTALVVEAATVRVGFAYDLGRATVGLRHLLRHCDALVLESNYDDVMLRTSDYPPSVQHRIAGSGGHLSNRAAAELAGDLLHEGLSLVVLAHLSQQCNRPDLAQDTVTAHLRDRAFRGTVAVAEQHRAVGPFAVSPSLARYRAVPQVEMELG
jgi:phosphoribosyl 1,2-cyclic phosphodiesterase